jgi:DnaK suppressor protein
MKATRPGSPEGRDRPQATAKPAAKSAAGKKSRPATKPAKASTAKQAAAKSSKPAKPQPRKPQAKPAPTRKEPAAKPGAKAAKTPAKSVAKPAAKPVAKPAAKAPAKPEPAAAQKTLKSVTLAKTTPAKSAAAAPAAPVKPQASPATPDTRPAAPPAPRASARASAKSPVHMPLPAVPSASDQASRFADRFSPAKPAARIVVDAATDTQRHVRKDPKLANAWKSKSGRELTEDELLAMPDNEYMNDQQLEYFRQRLTQLKDDLLTNAEDTTEHLREDTSIVPDPADRATIEEEHALELRTRDRERKLLKKISQSLARIESGDYGFCDETGEPIGIARLLARPTATLSLEAQQRRELKQKMFGD